ncbi:hypothetical protein BS50DRAFT_625025, partial [Corynespora cassiicola Philippines]
MVPVVLSVAVKSIWLSLSTPACSGNTNGAFISTLVPLLSTDVLWQLTFFLKSHCPIVSFHRSLLSARSLVPDRVHRTQSSQQNGSYPPKMPHSDFDDVQARLITLYETLLSVPEMDTNYNEQTIRLRQLYDTGIALCKRRMGSAADIEQMIDREAAKIRDEVVTPSDANSTSFMIHEDPEKGWEDAGDNGGSGDDDGDDNEGVSDSDSENDTFGRVAADLREALEGYREEYSQDTDTPDYREITATLENAIIEANAPLINQTPRGLWREVEERVVASAQRQRQRMDGSAGEEPVAGELPEDEDPRAIRDHIRRNSPSILCDLLTIEQDKRVRPNDYDPLLLTPTFQTAPSSPAFPPPLTSPLGTATLAATSHQTQDVDDQEESWNEQSQANVEDSPLPPQAPAPTEDASTQSQQRDRDASRRGGFFPSRLPLPTRRSRSVQ